MLQPIAWLVLAAIHLMPAVAFFRPALLASLYGISPEHPLFMLMHHRAALFVAVCAGCVIAALHPESRKLASVIAAISMLSFLWLWWRAGFPSALGRIAKADLLGLPALVYVALAAYGIIGR